MNIKEISNYAIIILFAIVLYLSFLVIKPFFSAVITSVILAYVFYPLYRKVYRKTRKKNFSALVVSLMIVLLITIPLFFMIGAVTKEVMVMYTMSQQKMSNLISLSTDCPEENILCEKLRGSSTYIKIIYYINENLEKMKSFFLAKTGDILISVPKIVLGIVITLFATFYFFRDGRLITRKLRILLSLKRHHEISLLRQFNDTTRAVLYGYVLLAILEGIIGGIGFWLFGITSPILWGIVMVVLAFLPVIGSAIIWAPAAVFLILGGEVLKGILLILYGSFLVSSISVIVRPKIIGDRAKIHPVLILLGVLGGIGVFGIIGFIVGPLVLALLVTFFEIYQQEKRMRN